MIDVETYISSAYTSYTPFMLLSFSHCFKYLL